MAQNTDLAKAKGSAETYAIKYFLQKFFLIPTDNNLDPDAFETKSPLNLDQLQDQTIPHSALTTQNVNDLINLFRNKTTDNKELQTKFLTELDQLLAKQGITDTTSSSNFRSRLATLAPMDYQYLYNWLVRLEGGKVK
jgi:hypothetical protein